jgi:hypothetical protein
LPWAGLFRPVGASVSAPVLTGHYEFTAEELEQKETKETKDLSGEHLRCLFFLLLDSLQAGRQLLTAAALDLIVNHDIKHRPGRETEEE